MNFKNYPKYLDKLTFLLATFFTFLYSSFIHLSLSLTLAWARFFF